MLDEKSYYNRRLLDENSGERKEPPLFLIDTICWFVLPILILAVVAIREIIQQPFLGKLGSTEMLIFISIFLLIVPRITKKLFGGYPGQLLRGNRGSGPK